MTNKKFYGDKLLAIAIWSRTKCQLLHELVFGQGCTGKGCGDCEFATVESVEKWLNAEHEEPEQPLLENGDGLKPGDWIMVRDADGESWRKRQFMCFYDNRFITAAGGFKMQHASGFSAWKQARLPMEGE